MDTVNISGQNISIGQSLQNYVNDRITAAVSKYFDHATSANVKFTKAGHEFVCDIVVNDGTGRHTVIKSECMSDDIYSAFDSSLSKVAKQLRRYKSRLKDRHDRIKVSEISPEAIKYTINANHFEKTGDDNEIDVDNPVIIAEQPTKILKLSVGEAVMHMDLQNLPALMFENSTTGRTNIVYYRKDGNISWVDSN